MRELLQSTGLTFDDIATVTTHTVDNNGKYEIDKIEWSHADRDYVLVSAPMIGTPEWEMAMNKYKLEIIADDTRTFLAKRKVMKHGDTE